MTSEPPARDPLAFFRAQEAPCAQFAQQVGNPVVEPERFSGAKVVRDLGRGATQIVDGRGTRLVVVPQRGIVLPESGRTDEAMPPAVRVRLLGEGLRRRGARLTRRRTPLGWSA